MFICCYVFLKEKPPTRSPDSHGARRSPSVAFAKRRHINESESDSSSMSSFSFTKSSKKKKASKKSSFHDIGHSSSSCTSSSKKRKEQIINKVWILFFFSVKVYWFHCNNSALTELCFDYVHRMKPLIHQGRNRDVRRYV